MSIDLKPILACIALFAVEGYLGSVIFERVAINSRAVAVTARVTTEPAYAVTPTSGRGLWAKEAGYQFIYAYEVNGRTFTNSGFHPEKPRETTTVYYDSTNPAVSRTRLEQTQNITLFMIFIGVGIAYNLWRIDWRAFRPGRD